MLGAPVPVKLNFIVVRDVGILTRFPSRLGRRGLAFGHHRRYSKRIRQLIVACKSHLAAAPVDLNVGLEHVHVASFADA